MKTYKHKSYSYVTITEVAFKEIDKIDFALCKQPTETLESYYKRQTVKPHLLVNGGFFSMADGTTAFTYKDEGKMISEQSYPVGVGIMADNRLVYGELAKLNVRDFITAYPMLIINGKINLPTNMASEIDYKARRTCMGWNDETVYFVTVDAPGMAFRELANMLYGIGCKYAMNLDGGGSTRMLVEGKLKSAVQLYNRPVDNVVAVYLKTAPKKVFYRVQTGAFLLYANAKRYLERVQALGNDYKGAYINKDGMYYKVQVGYFGVKANADRMVADLKTKGFSAFAKEEIGG